MSRLSDECPKGTWVPVDGTNDPAYVEGTVELAVSERDDCICCPAGHVYGRGITVDPYEGEWPYNNPHGVGDFAHDWVGRLWREHGYELHGRRVRVTLELLPAALASPEART